jgi:hypothetical protein
MSELDGGEGQGNGQDEARAAAEGGREPGSGNGSEPGAAEIPAPGLPPVTVDLLYRVFAVKKDMPPLEKLLARLTSQNPYNPEGGFVFPPGGGMKRLQDALGASPEFFVMGYLKQEAPKLWEELAEAYPAEAPGFDDDDHLMVKNANLCVVVRATIANPDDNAYVETLCHLADAFREMQRGVVWDVHMRKIWGHEEWRQVMDAPMSPLSHVQVQQTGEGAERTLRTSGLKKFGNADLEVQGGPEHLGREVEGFLLDASFHIMRGDLVDEGETITYHEANLRTVAIPQPEGAHPVLRFVDDPGPDVTEVDPAAGMARGLKALQAAREEIEGKRWEWQW